jgi:hypothetical protein
VTARAYPLGAGQAVLSDDQAYRYRLSRIWDEAVPTMLVIGLNPSTADATNDDATIRRCRGFAAREGCGGLQVVNLFAYRSTDPAALTRVADPVGPDNDVHIAAAEFAAVAVAAWGASGRLNGRDRDVTDLIHSLGVPLRCWGYTKAGHPRHPLYLPGSTPLQRFETRS